MLEKFLQDKLARLKTEHLYRSRKILSSAQSIEPVIDGQQVLSFSSNDYLGLANHPDIKNAFVNAANKFGVGSGAAHLVTGHSSEHHALEEELAEFVGAERALLFSTGYMANIGVASALLDRHDEIFEDKLNHASLLDAAQLSRAKRHRYNHADIAGLAQRLKQSDAKIKLVMTDGVFSMDGDFSPADKISALCQQHDAVLMIDDAHGLGCVGKKGKGTLEYFELDTEQVPVLVGTLGKAFGTAGAFVAGSEALVETLIQSARSYIFTTAQPAAIAAATRASLRLVQAESWRREKLQSLVSQFRQGASQLGLELMASETAIQPIIIGDAEKALKISKNLLDRNILISAIRPPTVPQGTARLRVTFCATHTEEHVNKLLDALKDSMQ